MTKKPVNRATSACDVIQFVVTSGSDTTALAARDAVLLLIHRPQRKVSVSTHTDKHTHTDTQTHTDTHTHTRARTHAHTHTHARTHAHTQWKHTDVRRHKH